MTTRYIFANKKLTDADRPQSDPYYYFGRHEPGPVIIQRSLCFKNQLNPCNCLTYCMAATDGQMSKTDTTDTVP